MAALDKIIAAKAKEFNALRKVYFPANSTLELLKISDGENDFEIIETLFADWYLKYSEYRHQFKLSVARSDAFFTDAVGEASNVRINADVYWIQKADTLPPMGTEPVWSLFCERGFSKGNIGRIY